MKFIDSSAKTNWKYLAIVGVLALIAFGGILLLQNIQPAQAPTPPPIQQTPPPQPSPSSQVLDTSNWQTYRNTAYNFSVDYPADWTTDHYPSSYPVEAADIISFYKSKIRTRALTEVGIYASPNKDSLSLKDFILGGEEHINIDYPLFIEFITPEAKLDYLKKTLQGMEETTFQGFEAFQYGENRLLVNSGTTVFVFYISSREDIVPKDRKIFNRILSTFRFIK